MKLYNKDEKRKVDLQFPYSFSAYNRFMGGVDVHNQHCCKLLPALRSKKWTWVIFLRFIQAAITNAAVLYNICGESKKACTKDAALSISRDYMNFSNTPRKKNKETSVKHEKPDSATFLDFMQKFSSFSAAILKISMEIDFPNIQCFKVHLKIARFL